MARIYKVSLKGLGYKAQTATVTANDAIESNDGIFGDLLAGLPTLDLVSVVLDYDTNDKESVWAKQTAWAIAFGRFQSDIGMKI